MRDAPVAGQTRFWYPREGQFHGDHAGFLLDPEPPYANALNPNHVRFHEIATHDCLVLLGEPGMGKTTVLDNERTRIERECAAAGDELTWIDLGDFGDEGQLVRERFETAGWDRWREGGATLHLFLDSLDECRLYRRKLTEAIY